MFKQITKIIAAVFLISCIFVSKSQAQKIENDTTVFEKVEIEASFPGGAEAWSKYLTKVLIAEVDKFKKSDYGTVYIKFIVNTKGQVSDVQATNMKRSRLAKVAVEAIENGPRWNPAIQDGRKVNAFRIQPVTLLQPK